MLLFVRRWRIKFRGSWRVSGVVHCAGGSKYSQEVQVVQIAQRVRGQAAQRAAVQPQAREGRAAQRAARHRLQPVHGQVPAQHATLVSLPCCSTS